MAATGYAANSATVGQVTDSNVSKPTGSSFLQVTPTIPGAIAQTTRSSTTAPYYTKTSSSILVLTMATTPGFTTGSKIGVFWIGADGGAYFVLDCTITSIVGDVVTITAPLSTLTAVQLAAGMLYFNGATTTGASDVAGKKVNPGTTLVTFSVATIATSDLPANPDITDIVIPAASLQQLLITCQQTGGIELIESGGPTVEFAWNYSAAGDFFNSTAATGLWSGAVDTIRFYNSSLTAQTMSVGALLA